MRTVSLLLGVAFVISCVHCFMGVFATQHASIRFMVRENALTPSGNAHLSPELREKFIQSEELQGLPPKIQKGYREVIHDARNAIAASRRGNALLTGVFGCLFLGSGIWIMFARPKKKSNKTQEGIGEELAKPSE